MRLLPALFALALASPAVAQTVEDGFKAYDAGDYATAKAILLPLAEAGDPRAMNAVGLLYASGHALPQDRELACDWYEKAANIGYVSAQSNLALCYQTGNGRNSDIDKAIFWTERAAEQGDIDNQVEMIRLYHDKNPEKARYWGQRATEAGSIPARLMMDDYKIPYSGPRPSRFETYCFIVMVGILKKPRNFCDQSIASQVSSSPP